VNKLLKKAKKAGRKLMRKLGIGKKKKKKRGDADDRTAAEMQADLKKGIQEATMFVKGGEKDPKKIKKKLKKIRNKYDLVELKLVIDKQNPAGEEKVHIEGEVNPGDKSEIFNKEMDEDENGNSGVITARNKSKKMVDYIETALNKNPDEFEGREKFVEEHKKLLSDWELNTKEIKTISDDDDLEKLVIEEFNAIEEKAKSSLNELKKAIPKEEKEKDGKLKAIMQPYRKDVWTKGPHLDIVFTDNTNMKITEARLILRGGLYWLRFGDMKRASKEDRQAAQRLIDKLLKNSSIMAEAKSQIKQAISEMEQTVKFDESKKEREQAERGIKENQQMLKLF
jgi:hypothetical protein